MQVNTTGVFLGTRFAIPAMQAAGSGSIVNISSIMGFVGGESGHPAYHASKGAVRIFTKAIAVQYGPDNIRANSIHPGFMPPMRSSRQTAADPGCPYRGHPLRRTGQLIEVANGGTVPGLGRGVFYYGYRVGHRRRLHRQVVPSVSGAPQRVPEAAHEADELPALGVRQRVLEAGHRRSRHAVRQPPENIAVGVIVDVLCRQVGGGRGEGRGCRAVTATCRAVAGRAVRV